MVDIVVFLFFLLVWFLPTFVARSRHLKNKVPCFWFNLTVGWIFPVWILLVIWALMSEEIE